MEASTTKLSLDWKNFDQSMRDNLSRLREGSEFGLAESAMETLRKMAAEAKQADQVFPT